MITSKIRKLDKRKRLEKLKLFKDKKFKLWILKKNINLLYRKINT